MITIKTDKEIEQLRQGGRILAQIMKTIVEEVKPGVATGYLEVMANFLIKQAGARPSFKGYKTKFDSRAYPTALCASINDEVVHAPALPARKLKSGDIIGLDLGVEYPYARGQNGYYTDMAVTLAVGKASKPAQKLIRVTRESLALAIEQVKPGKPLNDISKAVEQYAKASGFTVVRDLVGHGVGYAVHEDPQIPNYAVPGNDKIILKPGMVLAIEPMINGGDWRIKTGDDDLTILTADGSLSAHFEHTVVVTKEGCEVITKVD